MGSIAYEGQKETIHTKAGCISRLGGTMRFSEVQKIFMCVYIGGGLWGEDPKTIQCGLDMLSGHGMLTGCWVLVEHKTGRRGNGME